MVGRVCFSLLSSQVCDLHYLIMGSLLCQEIDKMTVWEQYLLTIDYCYWLLLFYDFLKNLVKMNTNKQ